MRVPSFADAKALMDKIGPNLIQRRPSAYEDYIGPAIKALTGREAES